MSILNGLLKQPKPTAAGFKIIHIGTDNLPVSILDMAPINGRFW